MATILDFKALREGMVLSDCVVYIQSYKRKPYAEGKKFYLTGSFVNQGESAPFKIWDAALVEALTNNDVSGMVAKITGSVKSYQNVLEINVQTVDPSPTIAEQFPASMFLKSINVSAVFDEFVNFVNTEISEKGVAVLMGIFKSENLFGRFKEEFAGTKMHDAQIGGLLNHTMKMLKYAKTLVLNEPRLVAVPNYTDLLYLGVILHDIGKLFEMKLGVYQDISFVTHRTLGVVLLARHEKQITSTYDEIFFYQILAIVQGHHGEFGDKPTTLMAYIVHLVDMIDSMTTGAFDKLDNNDVGVSGGGKTIYMNNGYLTV